MEVRDFRRVAMGALCAWAFIATVGIISLSVQSVRNTSAVHKATAAVLTSQRALRGVQSQQNRLHLQLVEGCERLNIQRATANAAYNAEYRIDKLFFTAIRAERPNPRQTRAQRHLTRAFLADERGAVKTIAWTQLTDCISAVATKGSSYKAPYPTLFVDQLPPATAMNAANARKASPVGSVP